MREKKRKEAENNGAEQTQVVVCTANANAASPAMTEPIAANKTCGWPDRSGTGGGRKEYVHSDHRAGVTGARAKVYHAEPSVVARRDARRWLAGREPACVCYLHTRPVTYVRMSSALLRSLWDSSLGASGNVYNGIARPGRTAGHSRGAE